MAEPVTTGTTSAAPSSSASPSSTPAPSTPASATATPSAPDSASTVATPAGEPPQERWPDILANTRAKTREEVETEYRQKYGWADQFARDPYASLEAYIDQFAAHPQYGPLLAAKAARLLNGRRGQSVPAVEKPKPDIPIVDASGQQVGWSYSAEAQEKLLEWREAQSNAAMGKRLEPLEQLQRVVEEAQTQAAADHQATTTLTELRRDPYFTEHEPKVKAALIAHPEWGDDVYRAWHFVQQTALYPAITQRAEQTVREQFKTQAAGATVHPGSTVATAPPKFKDFGEALRYYADHPQEAEVMAKR